MTVGRCEWYIYVLELEDGFWYVGISTWVERRFKTHCKGKEGAARFTKLHKPVRIAETYPLGTFDDVVANQLEQAKTIEYAVKYGYDKVSGGGYGCGGSRLKKQVAKAQRTLPITDNALGAT